MIGGSKGSIDGWSETTKEIHTPQEREKRLKAARSRPSFCLSSWF